MDARLQRRIQRYGWDKAASVYEGYWRAQLEPAQRRLLEMAAPRAGEAVLDVACGTGLVTFPVAAAVGSGGTVVATDISQAMVDALQAEAQRRGVRNVRAARMDAEALDLPDGAFDVALCCLGLMYVPDPDVALAEMRRVLRPGARAVAAVWGARDRCGWADIFPIVDARVHSEVCPLFFMLGTRDALARAFLEAGFVDVASDRLSTTLDYDSADHAIGAAFAGGPVALAYSRFDASTRAEAHAEYVQSIEPYRVGTRYEIPGEFLVVRGLDPRLPRSTTP